MKTRYFLFAALLLSLTLFFVAMISARGEPIVLKTNLGYLPLQIAGYQGVDDRFPQGVYDELQADYHLYRHYRNQQEELNLYIGYYGTAKGGRTGHNPYACLPGSGWGVLDEQKITLKPPYASHGVQINAIVAKKGDTYNLMLHWYQSAGTKVLTTGLQQNLQRFLGRLFYNRNDGAYIQVYTLTTAQNIASIQNRLNLFAEEVLELLPDYWPEEEVIDH